MGLGPHIIPASARNIARIAAPHTSRRLRASPTITSAGTYRIDGLKCGGVTKSNTTAQAMIKAATAIAATGDTREENLSITMICLGCMGRRFRVPMRLEHQN